MHSRFYTHWRAHRRLAARSALFFFMAIAVAAPSHAGKARVDYGAAPVVSGTPATMVEVGKTYSFRPTASDPEGRVVRFRAANLPGWLNFSRATGTLTGTPGPRKVGTYSNIQIRVTDGKNWAVLPPFAIQVVAAGATQGVAPGAVQPPIAGPVNTPPTISGTPPTSAAVGQLYTFRPAATDPDGNSLIFSIQGKPDWATFVNADGSLSGTPTSADVGTAAAVSISVSDGTATTLLPAFSITVAQTNRAPTITGSPSSNATVGEAYSFRPAAADADGDPLTFSIQGRPAWATFSSADGSLSGTPTSAGTTSNIVISVSDRTATTSLPAFSITVAQTNRAPTITGSPSSNATVGEAYSFRPAAADADGDPLTFSIQGRPAWATFSSADGSLSGTPTSAGTTSNIVISVSDRTATTSLPAFSITVAQTNRAPTITGSPSSSATVGEVYSFRPAAADADGDPLTFSIQGRPAWATFSSADGSLSGTPTSAGTTSSIVISVSDGTATTSLPAFSITVAQTNRAPTITGSPSSSATVGQVYAFRPSAADADGDPLTFSIQGRPAWATFSSADGSLSGTPTSAGTTSNIVISVSDGTATTSLPAFSITVAQTNRAPTITGSPSSSATVGQVYASGPPPQMRTATL